MLAITDYLNSEKLVKDGKQRRGFEYVKKIVFNWGVGWMIDYTEFELFDQQLTDTMIDWSILCVLAYIYGDGKPNFRNDSIKLLGVTANRRIVTKDLVS